MAKVVTMAAALFGIQDAGDTTENGIGLEGWTTWHRW